MKFLLNNSEVECPRCKSVKDFVFTVKEIIGNIETTVISCKCNQYSSEWKIQKQIQKKV